MCRCCTTKRCMNKQVYRRNSRSAVPSVAVEENWKMKPGTLKIRRLLGQIFFGYFSVLPPGSLSDYQGSIQSMMIALFSLLFSAQIILSCSEFFLNKFKGQEKCLCTTVLTEELKNL